MTTAEIVGDKIHISTTYQERHLASQIAGAAYKKDLEVWQLPISWPACLTIRGVFGTDVELGPKLIDWAWKERENRILPAMTMRDSLALEDHGHSDIDTIEFGHKLKLFPYQRVDAEFLALNRRALLANPPGLGKTGATIRTIQLLQERGENPYPAVVVCPNSLKFTVWQEGFNEWAEGVAVAVIDGSAAKRRKQLAAAKEWADSGAPTVIVMNWESVRLHSRLAPYGNTALTESEKTPKELNELGHRTVIFDEAHKMKDPSAKQTRAAWAVAHQAVHRYALTGTPVADDISDLWGILHALEPTWFPAKTKFISRYAAVSYNYFGGAEIVGINPANRTELFSIIDPIMRRLPKAAALPQLPPKLPVQYRYTPMTAKQQKAYDQMRDMMIAQLNQILVAPNPLSKLTRLLQFASASAEIIPMVVDEDTGAVLHESRVKLTDPSSKVDDMVDLLEEMGKDPLVVGAMSRQLIELASKRLTKLKIPHGLVTGAQSPLERQQAVKEFQDGKTRVILLTLGAGAEGITLTRADTMLFMQRSWSEIQNQQAEDRIHRIGSERHAEVRIIEQITPDSVEENKRDLLAGKQIRMEDVMRDEATLKKLLGV